MGLYHKCEEFFRLSSIKLNLKKVLNETSVLIHYPSSFSHLSLCLPMLQLPKLYRNEMEMACVTETQFQSIGRCLLLLTICVLLQLSKAMKAALWKWFLWRVRYWLRLNINL